MRHCQLMGLDTISAWPEESLIWKVNLCLWQVCQCCTDESRLQNSPSMKRESMVLMLLVFHCPCRIRLKNTFSPGRGRSSRSNPIGVKTSQQQKGWILFSPPPLSASRHSILNKQGAEQKRDRHKTTRDKDRPSLQGPPPWPSSPSPWSSPLASSTQVRP